MRQHCSCRITNQPCPGTAISRNDQHLPLDELCIMFKTLNLAELSFIQGVFSLVKIPLFVCSFSLLLRKAPHSHSSHLLSITELGTQTHLSDHSPTDGKCKKSGREGRSERHHAIFKHLRMAPGLLRQAWKVLRKKRITQEYIEAPSDCSDCTTGLCSIRTGRDVLFPSGWAGSNPLPAHTD